LILKPDQPNNPALRLWVSSWYHHLCFPF